MVKDQVLEATHGHGLYRHPGGGDQVDAQPLFFQAVGLAHSFRDHRTIESAGEPTTNMSETNGLEFVWVGGMGGV